MKNPTLVKIGKILIRLGVLNKEINELKEQKNSIIRGTNNQRLRVLCGHIEEVKYSFEQYKQLRAQNQALHAQLKRSFESQQILSQKYLLDYFPVLN